MKEKLEEEGQQKDKEQKAKVAAKKELTALLGQVETAKDDAMKEFRASQAFIDSYAKYYVDGFEDCLKQVKSFYPYLDLSKVSMDDPLLSTPAGDITLEENDGSSESTANPEDDGVILAQPALDKPIVPMTPSANPPNSEDPPTEEAQDLPPKGDKISKDPPAS